MTVHAEPAPPPGAAARIAVRGQVLFVLVLAPAAAALTSGFVSLAPNRLVSGTPVMLWVAPGGLFAAALVGLGCVLLASSLAPPRPVVAAAGGVLAAVSLLLTLAALGTAAGVLAAGAAPAARVSAGPA